MSLRILVELEYVSTGMAGSLAALRLGQVRRPPHGQLPLFPEVPSIGQFSADRRRTSFDLGMRGRHHQRRLGLPAWLLLADRLEVSLG